MSDTAPDSTTSVNAALMLKQYSEFVERTRDWSSVENLIRDREASVDQFQSTIPSDVAEFALFLRTPIMFQALVASAPSAFKQALLKAKQLADRHFVGIEEHPAVMQLLQGRVRSTRPDRIEKSLSPFTEFTGFHGTPFWVDGEDALVPVVAIALSGPDNRVLFRATINWDDVSFLASVAVTLLKSELSRARTMLDRHKLELVFNEVVGERIAEMTAAMEEIRVLAVDLKIPIPSTPASAEAQTTSG